MNDNKLKIDVEVNDNGLEKMADTIERIGDAMPNIVVRNNQNVYFTVNNWVEAKENKEKEEEDE